MEEDQTNAPAPGTTVAPTVGGTLNGSDGPVESAHQHETAGAPVDKPDDYKLAGSSPVHAAHDELQNQQGKLHEKVVMLAKRLESILATPFGGEQKAAGDAKPTNGLSPVVRKLEDSTAQSQNTEHVVDHLLNNLEV